MVHLSLTVLCIPWSIISDDTVIRYHVIPMPESLLRVYTTLHYTALCYRKKNSSHGVVS